MGVYQWQEQSSQITEQGEWTIGFCGWTPGHCIVTDATLQRGGASGVGVRGRNI